MLAAGLNEDDRDCHMELTPDVLDDFFEWFDER
jgi:hypothetical protein